MAHIHQIGTTGNGYTVVITNGYTDLTTHPSIVEHPDLFEIVETELPEIYQELNYTS
jgi:hypothetical protein